MNLFVYLSPILYFAISWFFPWKLIQWESSISVTYIYDLFFVAFVAILLRPKMKVKVDIGIFIRILVTMAMALTCILLTSSFGLKAPFKYVENLFIQILILAPIIEEFVFRFAFFELFKEKVANKKTRLLLNLSLIHI